MLDAPGLQPSVAEQGVKPSCRRPTRSLRRRSALRLPTLAGRSPPPCAHLRPPSLRWLTLAGWPPPPVHTVALSARIQVQPCRGSGKSACCCCSCRHSN
ncbi:hypothetical protein E2562_025928, partial [Oryza meyeriana var. granulata]